ncbi:MAG: TolC family protein, partial [Chlamydiia bacterium]|nr:TolC family protein [Chlamydiia bacterium]
EQLLSQQLTLESAVQLALLNNTSVQALLENVGVKEADFIQASLISNPVFEGTWRYPNRVEPSINIEYSLLASFLDIMLRPLRMRTARCDLLAARAATTDALLRFIAEVQQSFAAVAHFEASLPLLKESVEAKMLSFELSERLSRAGNVGPLFVQEHRLHYLEEKYQLDRMETEERLARGELASLLGLSSADCLPKIAPLQEPPHLDECSSRLVCLALENSFELEALALETGRIAQAFGLHEWWSETNLWLGAAAEKEPEGEWVVGPAISVALPIFNRGQAERARLWAEFCRSANLWHAKKVELSSHVEALCSAYHLQIANLIDTTLKRIPNAEEALETTLRNYNFMNASVLDLLSAKEQELMLKRQEAMLKQEAWQTYTALLRAVGGAL